MINNIEKIDQPHGKVTKKLINQNEHETPEIGFFSEIIMNLL